MAAASRIPLAEWEFHKENITALYMTEDKTLEEVIRIMAERHEFRATKAQYVRKLERWHVKKYSTNEKWKYVAGQVEKRKREGKDTDILINGKLIPLKKLKKETARYAGFSSATQREPAVENDVQSGVAVRTPPAEASAYVEYTQIYVEHTRIPWLQFQKLLESYISLLENTAAPIGAGTSFSLLHDLFLPASFDATPGMPGLSGSPSTLLPTMWMWDGANQLPNDTESHFFHHMLCDGPESDATFYNTQQPPSLPAADQTSREARELLGNCLGLSIDPDSPEYVSKVSSQLEAIAIDSRGGEVVKHVQQLCGGSALDISFQLLRYAVYFSSNGLLSDSVTDNLLEWVIRNKKLRVLEHLLDAKGPTIEIFASSLLVSAVRLGQIDAIRTLLAKGVSPDNLSGSFPRSALLEATETCHVQLVQLLLDAGADPNAYSGPFAMTPLEAAISKQHVTIAEMLICRGANSNAMTGINVTLLHLAIKKLNPGLVRLLLTAGININHAVAEWGTALQFAVRLGNEEIVKMLLKAGANVNCPVGDDSVLVCIRAAECEDYDFFQTPLQLAVINDDIDLVQILLDAGASVNGFPAGDHFEWLRFDKRHQDSVSDSDGFSSCGSEDGSQSGWGCFPADFDDDAGDLPITVLQAAVQNNNVMLVRLLLSLGADINAIGARGTALQIAASKPGRTKLVQLLLTKGANVNSPAHMPKSKTALQAAAESGDRDTLRLLLRAGADVNAPPNPQGGRSAVQAAAQSGNVGCVKLLVDAGADVNADAAVVNGQTCLQGAAENGDIGMVDYLLRLGADVNAPASAKADGWTALQAAIESDHLPVAERLLKKGADVNGRPSRRHGVTALLAAIVNKRYELAQLLLSKGAKPDDTWLSETPLVRSIFAGATEMVRRLVDAGADVNSRYLNEDDVETTPLQVAASRGDIDLIHILLDADASIHGTFGTIPLRAAVRSNKISIVKLLLSKGASPNPPPASKISPPLHEAVSSSKINEDMVRLLADHGALVDADHGSALRIAARRGSVQAVEILLQAGANVNAPAWGIRGKTALQGAVGTRNIDLVLTLLNAGADINAPPGRQQGQTALQAAVCEGSVRMVQLLLSHGADVNGPPSEEGGATALQYAAIMGHLGIVLMLLKSGADINAAGAAVEGRTALEGAAEHGRLDIACLLLQNDNDAETREARCRRAAELASSDRHHVIAKMLREWKIEEIDED